jgi:uncharacterized protein YjbI with pentapeptide repeats
LQGHETTADPTFDFRSAQNLRGMTVRKARAAGARLWLEEADFSTARLAKARAASVEMTVLAK